MMDIKELGAYIGLNLCQSSTERLLAMGCMTDGICIVLSPSVFLLD
jgi:hypothetical protein